ncbi:hypothetical protein G6F48_011453 [Rhizopus delemar]|nr:hypothetical protein G6F48_011453 [Rhizopus delemar]
MFLLANAWLKLNLEADESEMIVCYTTSTASNEETAECNIDETEENVNTEQDEQRVDIVECKKQLRKAYETILMYEVPLDDLDRKLHRRIRMRLADTCAELNKTKKENRCSILFYKVVKNICVAPLNRIVKIPLNQAPLNRAATGPGSDIFTKYIAQDQRVVDLVTNAIFHVPAGTYISTSTLFKDGTNCDALYISVSSNLSGLPPIILEFQRTTLTKSHSIHCLNMHRRLQLPETIVDPLSFFLNKLPHRTLHSFRAVLPWPLRWPTICTILHEFDYLCHDKIPPSPPPYTGQRLLEWLPNVSR